MESDMRDAHPTYNVSGEDWTAAMSNMRLVSLSNHQTTVDHPAYRDLGSLWPFLAYGITIPSSNH
jgi:hypothetical protein